MLCLLSILFLTHPSPVTPPFSFRCFALFFFLLLPSPIPSLALTLPPDRLIPDVPKFFHLASWSQTLLHSLPLALESFSLSSSLILHSLLLSSLCLVVLCLYLCQSFFFFFSLSLYFYLFSLLYTTAGFILCCFTAILTPSCNVPTSCCTLMQHWRGY